MRRDIGLILVGAGAGGAFTSPLAGFVLIVIGALLLFWPHLTRQGAKREEKIETIRSFHDDINRVYLAFIKASNDDEIAAAVGEYNGWVEKVFRWVERNLSAGEAEAFRELGRIWAADIIVQNPEKSLYRWLDKCGYMQRLDAYRPKVTALIQKVEQTS